MIYYTHLHRRMSDWPFQLPWHLVCEEGRATAFLRCCPELCATQDRHYRPVGKSQLFKQGAEGVHNPNETSAHAVSIHYSSWRHSMHELQRLMWISHDRQDCAALWVTPTVASLLPPGDWPSLSSWKPQLIHWEIHCIILSQFVPLWMSSMWQPHWLWKLFLEWICYHNCGITLSFAFKWQGKYSPNFKPVWVILKVVKRKITYSLLLPSFHRMGKSMGDSWTLLLIKRKNREDFTGIVFPLTGSGSLSWFARCCQNWEHKIHQGSGPIC